MELTYFLAKVLGVVMTVSALGLFWNLDHLKKVVKELKKSPATLYIAGFVALVFGTLLVCSHNVWVKDWEVIITLVGWAALVKGVALVLFPDASLRMLDDLHYDRFYLVSGFVMLVAGLYLGYMGFIY